MTDSSIDYQDMATTIELLMKLYNSRHAVSYRKLLKESGPDRLLLAVASELSEKGLVKRIRGSAKKDDENLSFELSDKGRIFVEKYLKLSDIIFGLFLQNP